MINNELLMKAYPINIGTKYQARNQRKDICTVIDILKTYNNAGELVSTKYLCEHQFMGQKVKHKEVETTIKMALIKNGEI